jgi:uncharacterized protein
MFVYRGSTALVTGASKGLGEVFADALAARGMSFLFHCYSRAFYRSARDMTICGNDRALPCTTWIGRPDDATMRPLGRT